MVRCSMGRLLWGGVWSMHKAVCAGLEIIVREENMWRRRMYARRRFSSCE